MKIQGERGMIIDSVKTRAKEVLGREITQEELRLFPFLDYSWKNGGYVDRNKLSGEEMNWIAGYDEVGLCKWDCGYSFPTKKFYDFVQECLFETYVQEAE